MAEAYGNRTHLGPCRPHNSFEGCEHHQALDASGHATRMRYVAEVFKSGRARARGWLTGNRRVRHNAAMWFTIIFLTVVVLICLLVVRSSGSDKANWRE